jgi:hypothetical protein
MSFKGPIEDKAAPVEMPRSLKALQDRLAELEVLLARGDKGRVEYLLADVEEARRRANHDHIFVYSRQGGPMAVLEAYADALNKAHELRGRALVLVNGLGTL